MESLPSRPPPARSLSELVRDWIAWFGAVRLVVTAISIVAIGAGGYWLLRAPATPVENSLPFASRLTSTTVAVTAPPTVVVASPTPAATVLVVYVAGAVVAPGVYDLVPNARVHDAVDAAGGFTSDADLDTVNLAALVADGDRVFIPRIGQPVPIVVTPSGGASRSAAGAEGESSGSASGESGPININNASVDELDQLPGIGPATAAAIVAHREQSGPFASVDDLLDVRGIGPAKLDAIRGLVTV